MIENLKQISESIGVSGHEGPVRQTLRSLSEPFVQTTAVDALGNLLAYAGQHDSAPRVLVAAHMDEIGIMVRKIDDDGFVRFATLGSLRPQVLLGTKLKFSTGVQGIVGMERIDEDTKMELKHLYVDIGASSRREALEMVSIGDTACFDADLSVRNHQIIGKALDDRIGCLIMLECMRQLQPTRSDAYCWAFTAQEEVGVRGAQVAAQAYSPDFAVVVDVTPAADTPKGLDYEVKLGRGAAVKLLDFIPPMGGFVAPPGVTRFVTSLAEKHAIKWQPEVLERGSTDAASIHLTGKGVPCAVISVPIRYSHTPHELIDKADVEAVTQLILAVLENLNERSISEMLT